MKFLILDGNSFCYRAFYAIRELRNSKGFPTNAVYGFITMTEKLLKDLKPDAVALTFDMKGPTFRHKQYADYKVQRKPMPDELILQMPVIKEAVAAFNIPIYQLQGFEADDLMATLAKKLTAAGHDVFLSTADKDALQLVTKKVKVVNPLKDNVVYDEAAVQDRFGVEPGRVVEIMALMGDASDNIPGVAGVGEVTAMKLIAEFGTLEKLYKDLSKVKGDKLRANLESQKEQAFLSRELATIDHDAPIEIDIDAMKRREPDTEKLAALYREMEFRTLLKNLPHAEEKNAADTTLDYTLITQKEDFGELVKQLSKKREWAFDFETTGVDAMTARPVGISFSFAEKQAFYVEFPEKGPMSPEKCLGALKGLFEDSSIRKIGQNIKYEAMVLMQYGIRLEGIAFDTMVASYCLNPAKPNHNLDDIAMEQLGLRITPITELIGTGRSEITMDQVPIEKVYRYGCQDSDITFRLANVLGEKLKEKGQDELFRQIEMPLVMILADIEWAGVAIDTELLAEFSKEMEKSLAALTKKIHKEAGQEFNINSPKQLSEILFDKLGLPVVKKTKTGASTNVEVLLELSEIHPLPKEILKFRELSKLKSTYVDALPLLVNPKTHRVHTSFNQTVTATGRLSSSEPNLQNIPVRTEEGRKIRRAFVAPRGCVLVSADYSQIELRVLAQMCGDESLVKAFREGFDIHRYTAGLIFNVDPSAVTDSMRNSAKTVNFGVLYGMGPFSLAKSLGITNEAAKDFIKAYFDRYPSVKKYLEDTVEQARKDGYVSTAFKRRRYLPEILSKDMRVKAFAERTAINAPLQGTASDVIKIAMCRIAGKLAALKSGARMISQVHDELLFEVPKDEVKTLVPVLRKEMQEAVSFKVPMEVSVKAGPNWLDMEPCS